MSATNQTVWICDWCGVQMHVPLKSSDVHGHRQHLCAECTDLIIAFLENR